MSAPINFISPTNKLRLSKTITPDTVKPYPLVKKLTSSSHHVACDGSGLDELYELLTSNALVGNALLKGPLVEPIVNESRRGKSDTKASTPLMVLDIDGWVPETTLTAPISQDDLVRTAESVINLLPEPLCSTSYIVNASSSTGVKPTGEIGLHFFFLLDASIHPTNLTAYFKHLNFSNKEISDRLTLQSSNMSLKWIVDPVVARNAQVIYIANPTFEDCTDPFASPHDRWALKVKDRMTCDITQQVMSVDHADVDGKANKALNKIRADRGLGKFKPRTRTMTIAGQQQRVLTNPDQIRVERSYATDYFQYWNINGGDSNAYYCPLTNPEIIYNFKGEPPFLLKVADKDAYDAYLNDHAVAIREVTESRPLLVRDPDRDEIFAIEYVPAHNEVVSINKIIRQNAEDWLAGFGRPLPDAIPTWKIEFDPHSVEEIDWENERINTYRATEYLKNPPMVMPQYQNVSREQAVGKLGELCPTIRDVLLHICGDDELELGYFLNWLAYAMQKREKCQTAWVFSGVPGTGKGVFYQNILRPLIGEQYAVRKRLDHLEEQFNAYQEQALFLIWEEFRLKDSPQSGKLLNKMKDDITADYVNIRAMRTDVRPAKSYTNYIFFSNHTDVIPVEKGDRRFNIAPPQMQRLEHKHPDFRDRFEAGVIDSELGSFAGFILSFAINVKEATTERNNQAKEDMRLAAMSPMDQFANAINTGDLEFFYRIEDIESVTSIERATYLKIATSSLQHWKKMALAGEEVTVTLDALRICFELIFEEKIAAIRLQTALARRDVVLRRDRTGSGKRQVCAHVTWQVSDDEAESLHQDIANAASRPPRHDDNVMMH